MCGICGFFGPPNPPALARMTEALAHRGPDASGIWSSPAQDVHFGHRRLSILDLSGGAQPMHTPDGRLSIVFNGEIYNFAELRAELIARGRRFTTDHSDTEVLLQGYLEWGSTLPERLNGMWAFVIYDHANRRLFASRDRFGKKPFFYASTPGAFVFASELSSLRLHPALANAGLSRTALKKYFGYGYIPAPHCILEGVFKLPGGCNLTLELPSTTPRIEKYWEFRIEPFTGGEIPTDPERAWGEQIRTLLDQAVKRRLVADVPVGVFLSGGIDSSAITAFASRHVPAGALKTFSIGFTEPSFDESAHARRVAELFGTDHHQDTLSIDKARELLPAIVAGLDEPMGDSSLLPTYLLARFTRRHVTVALGGDAGDELFAGYDPFQALRKAALYRTLVPKPVHEGISMLAARMPVSHRNMSLDFKVKRTLRGLGHASHLWLPIWMAPLAPGELSDLFNEPITPEELYSEAIAEWDNCAQENLIDRTLQFYTRLYLQDDILVKVDRATMAHGLEARAPFLDLDFINLARRIPADWKLRKGQTKYILKKALEPVLPRDILYRKKKGFGVPIGAWFKDGHLSAETTNQVHGLNTTFVREKSALHRAGKSDERAFLWNTWLLNEWLAKTPAGDHA